MRVSRADFPPMTLPVSESIGHADEFETRLDIFELWMEMSNFKIATGSLAEEGEKARLRGYQRYAVARFLEEAERSTVEHFVPEHSMSTISVPRKRGKSWLAAMLIMYWMTVHGQTCGVISATKEQSTKTIMNSMKRALEGSPLKRHFKFRTDTVEYRQHLGGVVTSEVLFLAARPSTLQGYALGLAIVDEAHVIEQRLLAPCLAVLRSAGGDTIAGTTVLQISTSNKDSSDPEKSSHPLFQDVFAVQDGEPPMESDYVAVWGHHDRAEFDVDDLEDYCLERLEDTELVSAIEAYINHCHGGMFGGDGEGSLGSMVSLRESWPTDERMVADWLALNMNYFSRQIPDNFEAFSFLPSRIISRARSYPEESGLWDGTHKSVTFVGLDGGLRDDYTAAVAVKWLVDEDLFIVDWARVWRPQDQPDHYVSNDDVFAAVSEYLDSVLEDKNTELGRVLFESHYLQVFLSKMRADARFAGKYATRATSSGNNGVLKNVMREGIVHRRVLLPRDELYTNDIIAAIGNAVISTKGGLAKKGGQKGRDKIDAAVALASATYAAELYARSKSPTGEGPISRAVKKIEGVTAPEVVAPSDRKNTTVYSESKFAAMFG